MGPQNLRLKIELVMLYTAAKAGDRLPSGASHAFGLLQPASGSVPTGPSTYIVHTEAPKQAHRNYFKAQIYTIQLPGAIESCPLIWC